MVTVLPLDLTGKMLTLSTSFTPITTGIGSPAKGTGIALLCMSVLNTCGLTTANMSLLKDAGKKQFALVTELTGCLMKE